MSLLGRGAFITGLFLACPLLAQAEIRAFFTSQESVEHKLVELIDHSHHSIDLALFRFASRPLAEAIARARMRHVKLRIVLDGHAEAEGNHHDLGIAFVAGEVRRLDGKRGGTQGIMHHKFVLFDSEHVVTGSFNWTAGAEHVNYENALLTDNSTVVADYTREFERLWDRAQAVDPISMDSPSAVDGKKLRIRALRSTAVKHPPQRPARKKHRRKVKKSTSH